MLIGADFDEPDGLSPVPDVLAAPAGAVRILHTLRPVIVVIAGGREKDRNALRRNRPGDQDRIDSRMLAGLRVVHFRTHSAQQNASTRPSRWWLCTTMSYRQPRSLSLGARNVVEIFFILCSREQIAFSFDASTVLRG